MKVSKAVISTATEYENDLNDEHAEYGTDRAVLIERLKAACWLLAPLSAWKILANSASSFQARLTIGEYSYEACHDVELVC